MHHWEGSERNRPERLKYSLIRSVTSFIQWEMRTKIILVVQGIELTVFLLVEKIHK